VVGQRVVIRHLLEDGRATDVLGVCTAWGEDTVTVESERGPVTIGVADIVTGKPVPPRASVRDRVPARDVEARSFAHDPAVSREPVGRWWVRSAPPMGGRLLKRANSALAMGDPGLPMTEASAAVLAAYRRLDRAPLAQVEQGSEVADALQALGWQPLGRGDSLTLVASVAQVARRLGPAPDRVRVEAESEHHLSVRLPEAQATGSASLDDDWLCLLGLRVPEAHRRRGHARGVLAELVDWGASRGARTVWLHVEEDNAAALSLYESLGFRAHHANRYLTHRVGR